MVFVPFVYALPISMYHFSDPGMLVVINDAKQLAASIPLHFSCFIYESGLADVIPAYRISDSL